MVEALPDRELEARFEQVRKLSCWKSPVGIEPLKGGMTNYKFVVLDGTEKYVVRLGDDIPVHQVLRFNERAANIAAHRAGIAPELIHAEPGLTVIRFIEGRTMTAVDMQDPRNVARVLALLRRCHREAARHLRGPILTFWPFHLFRDYAHTIREAGSDWSGELDSLLRSAAILEQAIDPMHPVFAHNDLLPANFIDDGARLWLLDWEYAGFGAPLFDLANFASNSELDQAQERELLLGYFGREPDETLWRSFRAMRCVSLLRESMWAMVAEKHSTLAIDFREYAERHLHKFRAACAQFEKGSRA
jgi:thiamine kinase-like enzyme